MSKYYKKSRSSKARRLSEGKGGADIEFVDSSDNKDYAILRDTVVGHELGSLILRLYTPDENGEIDIPYNDFNLVDEAWEIADGIDAPLYVIRYNNHGLYDDDYYYDKDEEEEEEDNSHMVMVISNKYCIYVDDEYGYELIKIKDLRDGLLYEVKRNGDISDDYILPKDL